MLLRILTTTLLVMFLAGCTRSYHLNYQVVPESDYVFTAEDLSKIDKGLTQVQKLERAGEPQTYFLHKSTAYWDILTFNANDRGLMFTILRISKYLSGFSDGWKNAFEQETVRLVEGTTNQMVAVQRVESGTQENIKED